jgi:hypothetical protein
MIERVCFKRTAQESFDCELEDREKGLTDEQRGALGMITQTEEI